MKLFSCQGCGQLLYFENIRCENCGRALGYLPDMTEISALDAKPELERGVGKIGRPRFQQMVDGRVVSDFTAADFTPRKDSKDGTVDVVKPEARFFLKNGKIAEWTDYTIRAALANQWPAPKA